MNPYVEWLKLPESNGRPNYYDLLGVNTFEEDDRKIRGAYYRRVAAISVHQTGDAAEVCKSVLLELAEARDCLTDEQARASYNETLRRRPGQPPAAAKKSRLNAAQRDPKPAAGAFSARTAPPGVIRTKGKSTADLAALSEGRESIKPDRAGSPFDMLSVMRTPEEVVQELMATQPLSAYQQSFVDQADPSQLVLGPYLIENEFPLGSWGTVYLSSRISTSELASVRSVTASLKPQIDTLKKVLRKAKTIKSKRFQRPVDCGTDRDRLYLASEYIPGEDLGTFVDRNGTMSLAQSVHCLLQVIEALHAARRQNLLHLELRPSKLLINRGRRSIRSRSGDRERHFSVQTPRVESGQVDSGPSGIARLLPCSRVPRQCSRAWMRGRCLFTRMHPSLFANRKAALPHQTVIGRTRDPSEVADPEPPG